MLPNRLKTIRYWLVFSCVATMFAAQRPASLSGIVGANSNSSGAFTAAGVPAAQGSSLCISGSLDGPNTATPDPTFNRPGSSLPIPPCTLTGAFTLYDAYVFTVTGCTDPTITISTCTGPCGVQGPLDTLLYLYQKPGGAPAGPGGVSPIFGAANPCTNLKSANNNFCSPASQITTTVQTTAGIGDFVVVVTANSPFSAGSPATFGAYNLRVDAPGCTVVQQPAACLYSLSPTEDSFAAAGGSESVAVTAGVGCAWTAISNDGFITINSGAAGAGNGTVAYSVSANPGSARIGTMTIAGQTFTVTQAAGSFTLPCIMDALVEGPTFHRPSAGPITCPTSPGAITPQNPQGFTNPAVFYKAYELSLTGCSSGLVTVNTCGLSPCSSGPGTLADTVLFIYRKTDGSPGSVGSPIFDPSSPCTNAVAANNNSSACGVGSSLSQISTVLNAGSFVVVVTSNGAGQVGTFSLAVTASGCTVSQCVPISANAGPDQTVCGSSATLAANTPTAGTGTWSVVSGSGTFTDSHDPNTTVTGLAAGANVLRWEITNGACPPASDEVTITTGGGASISDLGDANVWVGLKNSDDVGTKFDFLAEVLKNGVVVGSGQINDQPGGSSGFNNAILRTIDMALSSGQDFCTGDTLGFRLSVRVAASSGHVSGTARLWYNDSAANSRFTATVNGSPVDYFLLNGFVLGTSAGPGPRKTIDVLVNRNVGGNPFKPFGTWTTTF